MRKYDREIHQGGIVEDTHDTEDGGIGYTLKQDITQLLKDNKRKRNETSSWIKYDPKQDYHQVLDLSMTDVVRIKNEHGVDILGKNVDWKYVFKLIETHYPYMKTTTARL
tara:strand:+ start:8176 stop:8505 length:330 start_codon:yes stop_codon:yes gene_type:complete